MRKLPFLLLAGFLLAACGKEDDEKDLIYGEVTYDCKTYVIDRIYYDDAYVPQAHKLPPDRLCVFHLYDAAAKMPGQKAMAQF
jgi:hypothetical protein